MLCWSMIQCSVILSFYFVLLNRLILECNRVYMRGVFRVFGNYPSRLGAFYYASARLRKIQL